MFVGLDVGKEEHHACALDIDGNRVYDKALPQDETRLRELLSGLQERGPVLVVVDPASLDRGVAGRGRASGGGSGGLPARKLGDAPDRRPLCPGNAKTDARDAYVIAEAARSMPHALRRVDTGDEASARSGGDRRLRRRPPPTGGGDPGREPDQRPPGPRPPRPLLGTRSWGSGSNNARRWSCWLVSAAPKVWPRRGAAGACQVVCVSDSGHMLWCSGLVIGNG